MSTFLEDRRRIAFRNHLRIIRAAIQISHLLPLHPPLYLSPFSLSFVSLAFHATFFFLHLSFVKNALQVQFSPQDACVIHRETMCGPHYRKDEEGRKGGWARRTCMIARVCEFAREKFLTAFSPSHPSFPSFPFRGIFDKQGSRGRREDCKTLLCWPRWAASTFDEESRSVEGIGGGVILLAQESLACRVRSCVRGNGSRRVFSWSHATHGFTVGDYPLLLTALLSFCLSSPTRLFFQLNSHHHY